MRATNPGTARTGQFDGTASSLQAHAPTRPTQEWATACAAGSASYASGMDCGAPSSLLIWVSVFMVMAKPQLSERQQNFGPADHHQQQTDIAHQAQQLGVAAVTISDQHGIGDQSVADPLVV